MIFLAFLSWPIVSIFNYPNLVFGIPLFVLYLFIIWLITIAILLLINLIRNKKEEP